MLDILDAIDAMLAGVPDFIGMLTGAYMAILIMIFFILFILWLIKLFM